MIDCYHCGTPILTEKSITVVHTETGRKERICGTCVYKQADGKTVIEDMD